MLSTFSNACLIPLYPLDEMSSHIIFLLSNCVVYFLNVEFKEILYMLHTSLYSSFSDKQTIGLYEEIYKSSHVILEAKKFHELSSTNWKTMKASGLIQFKSKGLRMRRANGKNPV